MVISVKETTVFSVFHPDAQDLYNTCSDLKRVAYELWDPSFRLNASVCLLPCFLAGIYAYYSRIQDKTVQLFHAFAPMLCKRPTRKIEETVREMGGSEFFIEEKLDGERMQLHKRGTNISIALGTCDAFHSPYSSNLRQFIVGKAKTTHTSMANMLELEA